MVTFPCNYSSCDAQLDIDAVSFMVENMLSAVCSSASVTNVIYLVFVPCFIIRYNHHLWFVCVCVHIYSMKKIMCFTCCVCQYWGCGGKDLTPHALNVAHHVAVG